MPCLTFTKLASAVDLNNLAIWWPLPVNTALRYRDISRSCACLTCCTSKQDARAFSDDAHAVQYTCGTADWLANSHGDQTTKGAQNACHSSNRVRSVHLASSCLSLVHSQLTAVLGITGVPCYCVYRVTLLHHSATSHVTSCSLYTKAFKAHSSHVHAPQLATLRSSTNCCGQPPHKASRH